MNISYHQLFYKILFAFCAGAIITLFISCEQSGDDHYAQMFENRSMASTKQMYETEDVYMRFPFRIHQKDSAIYITDIHSIDYFCHKFKFPEIQYSRSLAKKGNGPDEFLDIENIRIDSDNNVWVLDANRAKISKFDYLSGIKVQEINLSRDLVRTLDFDLYNDSTFIVPDYTGKNRICYVNKEGEITQRLFNIPIRKKDDAIADVAYAQAWRSFIDYNEDNGVLAVATQMGQVVEFYDLKSNSLINVFYGKSGEPEFSVRGGYAIPEGIMGYSDVYVGQNYVYAIFWGHSFKEIKNNGDSMVQGGCYIHQFDLKGHPVKEIVLDRYITGFVVDEKNKCIIGLDVNSDQPIVEFPLL